MRKGRVKLAAPWIDFADAGVRYPLSPQVFLRTSSRIDSVSASGSGRLTLTVSISRLNDVFLASSSLLRAPPDGPPAVLSVAGEPVSESSASATSQRRVPRVSVGFHEPSGGP